MLSSALAVTWRFQDCRVENVRAAGQRRGHQAALLDLQHDQNCQPANQGSKGKVSQGSKACEPHADAVGRVAHQQGRPPQSQHAGQRRIPMAVGVRTLRGMRRSGMTLFSYVLFALDAFGASGTHTSGPGGLGTNRQG